MVLGKCYKGWNINPHKSPEYNIFSQWKNQVFTIRKLRRSLNFDSQKITEIDSVNGMLGLQIKIAGVALEPQSRKWENYIVSPKKRKKKNNQKSQEEQNY